MQETILVAGKMLRPFTWRESMNVIPTIWQLDEDQTSDAMYYFVDLDEGAKLSEWVDDTHQWIQVMPLGNYKHPIHGEINITPERVNHYAEQINSGVRGQDLNIDYDHKTGPAAGWIKRAEARQNGLYALVEWTKKAADEVKTKVYRYFSPEIHSRWEHPTDKKVYTDVLFGGGLTNRPFLKGIQPLTLSEQETIGDNAMDRELLEKLATKLGIKFDAAISDDDLSNLVNTAANAEDETETETEETNTETTDEDETEKELVALSEDNPVVKKLLSELNASKQRLRILETDSTANHVKLRLSELDNDNAVLSPVAKTLLSEIMINGSPEIADKAFKFAELVLGKDGIVQLGEKGGRGDPTKDNGKSATDLWEAEVKKFMEDHKDLSYSDAVVKLAAENYNLYEEYDREIHGGGK